MSHSDAVWESVDGKIDLIALGFVHGLIGVVGGTTVCGVLLQIRGLLIFCQTSFLLAAPTCALIGWMWWRWLTWGDHIASNVKYYDSELFVQVAIAGLWLFPLVMATMAIYGSAVLLSISYDRWRAEA